MKNLLIIPIFIPHRGCPHDCLFCNQQKISGAKRDPEENIAVAAIIEEWLQHRGNREKVQVAFFGGSFTCMAEDEQRKLLGAVQPYIANGQVGSIRCSTRPDCINEARCQIMQDHHVTTVELGVQSMEDLVLAKARRGHNSADSEKAFGLLKKSGIEVGIQLMPGLPGDTTRTFLQTVRKTIALGPDFVRLYPCVVVENSGLEGLYRSGGFRPLSLKKAVAVCCFHQKRFQDAGINVIRIGLQPSDSLTRSVVAGPYHPAFGELVQSRSWLKNVRTRLRDLKPSEYLEIHLSHRDVSAAVGQKRCNVERLEDLGFANRFTFVANKNMQRGSVEYVVSK